MSHSDVQNNHTLPTSQSDYPCRIAIFGSTSDIGTHIALLEAPGNHIILLSRRPEDQVDLEQKILATGALTCQRMYFDARRTEEYNTILANITHSGVLDRSYLMFGILGNQSQAEYDSAEVVSILDVDFTAQAALLTALRSVYSAQLAPEEARNAQKSDKSSGYGTMIAFSSIAGNRVRKANYIYGSAKYGLDGFCKGMQDSLEGSGIRLLIVRPGFVIGTMTQGMDPAPLSSTPDQVAHTTLKALNSRRNSVWVPGSLAVLAWIMRLLPREIWKHLSR